MKRFRDEVRIIPRLAWGIVILLYIGLVVFFVRFVLQGESPLSFAMAALFAFPALLVPAIYILLVGYIYSDAKRRAMRHVLWTWLAALIPNGIGIILYFILRDPLLVPCPACGVPTRPALTFCPKCGTSLAPSCPQCQRALEPGWSHCGYCGSRLSQN